MNLQLNAKQKNEIRELIKQACFEPNQFDFITRESECVFVYVQHAYRALDGNEPTTAEAISYQPEPQYFFTFERDERGTFFTTTFPELDLGRNIRTQTWQRLLSVFKEWLDVLKCQSEQDSMRPAKSRTFVDLVHESDYEQIRREFSRAEQNCISDPPAAITAASSMVESACKTYISDHGLEMPSNQSIKPLWNTVARDILPNPSTIADDDIKKLISGLASVVDGLGSLRTHTSSAHGRGKAEPPVGIAEALLAIHGSQALVLYMIQKRNKR
jgi:hypothetical protein